MSSEESNQIRGIESPSSKPGSAEKLSCHRDNASSLERWQTCRGGGIGAVERCS